MDIFGRIRAFLGTLEFEGDAEPRVYAWMARAAATRGGSPAMEAVRDGYDDEGEERRGMIYEMFREAGAIRAFGRGAGDEGIARYLRKRWDAWRGIAEEVPGKLPAAESLWCYWLLLLGERELGVKVEVGVLERMWEGAFGGQTAEGTLRRQDAEELLDGFVFDELAGLHAAYNAARLLGDGAKLERVRRMVRWHVEHTQPDHTTSEPWGLAAFAALDETGTFAEQQFHDAVTNLRRVLPGQMEKGRVPAAVGLLADAVLTGGG
jgi:hypothetical protein